MNATALLEDLRRRGALVRADQGDIVVSARKGLLTDADRAIIIGAKGELLQLLCAEKVGPFTPLVEYAASILPKIRMTIHESGDTKRDFDLVNRIRQVIQEFQPGANHVYLRIVTVDGRRVVVEWRALADRQLRLALARVLARAAMSVPS